MSELSEFSESDPTPDDTTVAVAEGGLTIGALIAQNYMVKEVLGKGAYSRVYKVTNMLTGNDAALKVLKIDTLDETTKQRFFQEAKILSALKHQNLATFHAFGESKEAGLYILMEWVDGRTLSNWLDAEKSLLPQTAVPLFLDLCSGLAYAHSCGVLHRDLKPDNIMVTARDDNHVTAKIIDFGLARSTTVDQRLTRTGAVVGSPFYMSPEQCRSQSLDARSDIYSLGCVMYHALAGEPPFSGENVYAIMAAHTGTEVTYIPVNSDIPKSLQEVVLRCLRKDPAERYQSIAEVARDLRGVDFDTGRILKAPGVQGKASARTSKWMVALVVLALLSLGYVGLTQLRSAKTEVKSSAALFDLPVTENLRTRKDVETRCGDSADKRIAYYRAWLKQFGPAAKNKMFADAQFYLYFDRLVEEPAAPDLAELREQILQGNLKLLSGPELNRLNKRDKIEVVYRICQLLDDSRDTRRMRLMLPKLIAMLENCSRDHSDELRLKLARLYAEQGEYVKAEDLANEVLIAGASNRIKYYNARLALERFLLQQGRTVELERGLKKFEEELRTFPKKDDEAYIQCARQLADLYMLMDDLEAARYWYAHGLEHAKNTTINPPTMLGLLRDNARVLLLTKRNDESKASIDEAFQLALHNPSEHWKTFGLYLMGSRLSDRNFDVQAAIKKEVNLFPGQPPGTVLRYLLGTDQQVARIMQRDAEQELLIYAAKYYLDRDATDFAVDNAVDLSGRLQWLSETDWSLKVARHSWEGSRHLDASRRAALTNAYAEALRTNGRAQEALSVLLKEPSKIRDEAGSPHKVFYWICLANVYRELAKFEDAEKYFKEAKKVVEQSGVPPEHYMGFMIYDISEDIANKRFKVVEEKVNRVLAEKVHSSDLRGDFLRGIAAHFSTCNDYSHAIKYLHLAFAEATKLPRGARNNPLISYIKHEAYEVCSKANNPSGMKAFEE